jgi:hypothetical protein
MPPRIAVAVTQIILHHVQATLPLWASVSGETVNLNRKEYKRHKDARECEHAFGKNCAALNPSHRII